MPSRFISLLHAEPISRAPEVSRRAVWLGLAGRFTDELLSGLPDVLMPTLSAVLGLNYIQVGLLPLALGYVALVVEPLAGLLIDLWQRRWLLAWGAAGLGLAMSVMGLAQTFPVLLAGFALYGLASGPLAHTADVVLVEGHPRAPGRIFARATALDTVGALLAPLLVTVSVWAGFSWRSLLLSVGSASILYAVLLLRTHFPPPANADQGAGLGLLESLRNNVAVVLGSPGTRRWLAFLFVLDVLEAPLAFKTLWLNEQAGLDQALVGLHRAMEMAVSLVSVLMLDRWLARANPPRILQCANAGLLLLYPLWLYVPGLWARFLLAIPLNFLFAVYWPIGRAQALAGVPGRGGTVSAVHSLFGLVPLPLLFGLAAANLGLTAATLWTSLAALAALVIIVSRLGNGE